MAGIQRMNTKILQKCLDELGNMEPNISYVRGMLETLIEMQDFNPILDKYKHGSGVVTPMFPGDKGFDAIKVVTDIVEKSQDESSLLDATAKAQLAKTMELAGKSIEP